MSSFDLSLKSISPDVNEFYMACKFEEGIPNETICFSEVYPENEKLTTIENIIEKASTMEIAESSIKYAKEYRAWVEAGRPRDPSWENM